MAPPTIDGLTIVELTRPTSIHLVPESTNVIESVADGEQEKEETTEIFVELLIMVELSDAPQSMVMRWP